MDVASLILACSFFGQDALVEGIIRAESAAQPMYVRAQGAPIGFPFESRDEALGMVRQLRENGQTAHVGLMGVTPKDAQSFGVPVDKLFDPCMSIAVGSELLSRYSVQCGGTESQPRVGCALNKYARMLGREPDHFATTVLFEKRSVSVNDPQDDAPSEKSTVHFQMDGADSVGSIFFTTPSK